MPCSTDITPVIVFWMSCTPARISAASTLSSLLAFLVGLRGIFVLSRLLLLREPILEPLCCSLRGIGKQMDEPYVIKGIVRRLPNSMGIPGNIKIGKPCNPKPTCGVVMGWMSFDENKTVIMLQKRPVKHRKA